MRAILLAAALLLPLVAFVPTTEAYFPVCIEKTVPLVTGGSIQVWVTCYPGVWHCGPYDSMPDCDRITDNILS